MAEPKQLTVCRCGRAASAALYQRFLRSHRRRGRFLITLCVAAGLLLSAAPAGWAADPFTERCIALKAQLATLDCKQIFREARALLSDGQPYLSNVAQELRSNRGRLEASSALLRDTTHAARDCLVKHVREAPAVAQAYTAIDALSVKLGSWITHKWEFPADFARNYQRDLIDKYNHALEAMAAAERQL